MDKIYRSIKITNHAQLNKKIHLLFKESVKEIPKELKNNILNGIILKGYITVF